MTTYLHWTAQDQQFAKEMHIALVEPVEFIDAGTVYEDRSKSGTGLVHGLLFVLAIWGIVATVLAMAKC